MSRARIAGVLCLLLFGGSHVLCQLLVTTPNDHLGRRLSKVQRKLHRIGKSCIRNRAYACPPDFLSPAWIVEA